MDTLHAATLRHLWRHPAQLALALLALALGVSTIVAVDVAIASAQRAFELSLQAVNGAAGYQIVGGPAGIDEQVYVRLRTAAAAAGAEQAQFAPLVSGYATIADRVMQLTGIDPFASAELQPSAAAAVQGPQVLAGGLAAVRRWLLSRGGVAMSAAAARQLHLVAGTGFTLTVSGVPRPARLIELLPGTGAAFDALLLTDIAQAQEWLGAQGRLSRIDVRLP